MRIFTLFILILAGIPGFAQSVDPATLEISTLQLTASENLTGQQLYEHLKGNADLFFEYGCQELYVREYTVNNEKLKLELYVMQDAPSAFGIYKLSISNCIKLNTLTDFSCQSNFQTLAAYGPLFMSITQVAGTGGAMDLSGQIAKAVIAGNPQEQMFVPALFKQPKVNKFLFDLHYYKGHLGLQRGLPQWVQMFQDLNFQMFVEKVPSPDTSAIIARITFSSNADLTMFLSGAGLSISDRSTAPSLASSGLYHSWYYVDESKIIFLETQVPVSLYKYLPELVSVKKSIWDYENQ